MANNKTQSYLSLGFIRDILFSNPLPRYIRQKPHKSCALDSNSELALILGTNTCTLATDDASVWIQKFLKNICILVIYILNIVLGEITLFCHDNNLMIKMVYRLD